MSLVDRVCVMPCDAEMIGAALGFVALLVERLALILNISIPHRLEYSGSRSYMVKREIVESASQSPGATAHRYPLFVIAQAGSTARVKPDEFNHAIHLLNVNVA